MQLPSGEAAVVQRHETLRSYGDPGYSEWRIERSSLVVMPPGGNPALPELVVGEFPLVLGRDGDQWFVIAHVELCQEGRELGIGKRLYLEYRLEGSNWRQHHVGDERVGMKTNLLLDKSLAKEQLVRIKDKVRATDNAGIPTYLKQIVSHVPCSY